MIVVDASLAAKWVAWEADSATAFRFLDRHGHELAAPDLLLGEVAGSIVRRARAGEIDRDEADAIAAQWILHWRDGLIQTHQVGAELVDHAIKLALTLDHKLPDCVYLALAIELGCELATCDRKFHAKASAHLPAVKLLAEYDLE